MLHSLTLTLALSLTTACAISIDAVPEDHTGEAAYAEDSIDIQADLDSNITRAKVVSFELNSADKTRVLGSVRSSLKAFNGSEESDTHPLPKALTHKISAQPQNLLIQGSVLYTEPPYTQFNGEEKTVFRKHDIRPKPGNSYKASGTANNSQFDVWLETPKDTSVIQDTFVEKKGAMADFLS